MGRNSGGGISNTGRSLQSAKEKQFSSTVTGAYKAEYAKEVARLSKIDGYIEKAPTNWLQNQIKGYEDQAGKDPIKEYISAQVTDWRSKGSKGQINVFWKSNVEGIARRQAKYKFIPQMKAELKKRGVKV